MSSKISLKNTDVLRFLLNEFNNTSFKDRITFSIAQWKATQSQVDGLDSLLIQRIALNNNDGFDVLETFDENTYAFDSETFVPMNISNFNADPTAIPQQEIKEVVYNTTLDFFVYLDDVRVQEVINLAIEEARANLIQKHGVIEVRNLDLDNKDNADRIVETFKFITMAGGIEYGAIVNINGKNYMTYHLDLVLYFVDKAEFSNQQRYKLGVESLKDENDNVIMFDITPYLLDWHWAETITHESTQLLNTFNVDNTQNENEVVSIPATTGRAISFTLQMDFNCPILRDLYIKSKSNDNKGSAKEKYFLRDETLEYDNTLQKFILNEDMKIERTLYRSFNQPNNALSKGEKIIWSLTLTPAYIESVD